MERATSVYKPVATWDTDDVVAWVQGESIGHLAPKPAALRPSDGLCTSQQHARAGLRPHVDENPKASPKHRRARDPVRSACLCIH